MKTLSSFTGNHSELLRFETSLRTRVRDLSPEGPRLPCVRAVTFRRGVGILGLKPFHTQGTVACYLLPQSLVALRPFCS